MPELGKLLVAIGVIVVLVGVLVWTGVGRGWLGRMPGDVHYSGNNFSFHFPIVTCLLFSIVLTVVMWLLRKL
jgi:ribose/xylose/arabinose/galactoside ABC-type transport system permease subunit